MIKLTGPLLGAMLLTSVPASASGLVLSHHQALTWGAAAPSAEDTKDCALELSIPPHTSPGLRLNEETAFDSSARDNRWASGAAYQWNAGMNRAVDHLLTPPDNVQFHVTQTGDEWHGQTEGDKSPNK